MATKIPILACLDRPGFVDVVSVVFDVEESGVVLKERPISGVFGTCDRPEVETGV
jgi:hypothetical protein